MNPTISIVNRSRTVSDADIKRNLVALQKQITRDFEPAWGWAPNLKFNAKRYKHEGGHQRSRPRRRSWLSHRGWQTRRFIFAKDDIEGTGEFKEYTSTLSHELLEMIADPNVIFTPPGNSGSGQEQNGILCPGGLRSGSGKLLQS